MLDHGAYWLTPKSELNWAAHGHLEWIASRVASEFELRQLTAPESDRVALCNELYDRAFSVGYIRVVAGPDPAIRYNYTGGITPEQLAFLQQLATDHELALIDTVIQRNF